ncbi:MAG TPA: amidase family protein, partial [Arenibaculum sp.]|nr:amidase family protein [Arenibaculum sp.]
AIATRDGARARLAARDAERMVMEGRHLGPLHGIPVGIKDLAETAGLRTTFGSLLFADHGPTRDAGFVASLRAAGAIVLAKTNTPEFGAGAVTTNKIFGMTGNPFAPELTCGGSSGGSAVALATGMVPLATGSDFGGSLRIPAAWSGVVGFRPSPGLVPDTARVRGWSPLSVEGPMARNVADLALMLSVMAGDDADDPLSRPVDGAAFRCLPEIDLAGIRAGMTEDLGFAPVDRRIRRTFRERMEMLAPALGMMEPVTPEMDGADDVFAILRGAEYLATHGARAERFAERLGPQVLANVEYARGLTLNQVVQAESAMTRIARRFRMLFERVDVVICPAAAVPPFAKDRPHCAEVDGKPMDSYFRWLAITYGLTLTGCPVVCLPCGRDPEGMPFGIQVCGPKGGDLRVLAVAAALERQLASLPATARPVPAMG